MKARVSVLSARQLCAPTACIANRAVKPEGQSSQFLTKFNYRAAILLLVICWLPQASAQQPAETASPAREALTHIGVEPTGPGALEFLRHVQPHDPQQREAALKLIEQLGDEQFLVREGAMRQLVELPVVPLEPLMDAGRQDNPEVAWRARLVLEQSATRTAQSILAAVNVVSDDRPPGALAELLAIIPLCRQPYVLDAAQEAVRTLAGPDDLPRLREALRSSRSETRVAALAALAKVTAVAGASELVPWLSDGDDRVTLEAARGLADLGDRRSLPALIRLLESADMRVRTESATTLRGLTGQYLGYAAYDPPDKRAAAVVDWQKWLNMQGQSAELVFPVVRHRSARGDLHGHTLVSTGSLGRVMEIDPAGNVVWSYGASAWSAEKLLNGHVLIGAYNENRVIEVDAAGINPVWEFPDIAAMSAKPLLSGNILVADFTGRRVVEINRQKHIVWEHAARTGEQRFECFDADRLPNGNTIYCCPNLVREVTPDHTTVRQWTFDGRLNGFHVLPSGSLIVANYGLNKVQEVTEAGREVWEYSAPQLQPCDVFRLSSGNTLITTASQIIEVNPQKMVVRRITDAQYGSARQ